MELSTQYTQLDIIISIILGILTILIFWNIFSPQCIVLKEKNIKEAK